MRNCLISSATQTKSGSANVKCWRRGTCRMRRWASFALVFLLLLFSRFCFGQQPATDSTAFMRGLRGTVHSVLTESFTYGDDGKKKPGRSERSVYDRSGYQTELYEYDFRGLRSHTVYTR